MTLAGAKQKPPKTMFDPMPWLLYRLTPRLKELKLFYEQGVMPALYDALVLARENEVPPPNWVLEGAQRVIGDRLKLGFVKGIGVTGNEASQYRFNMMHFRRWQAVKLCLSQGSTLDDAYYDASELLKGTFAKGQEDTMKASYGKVSSDLQDPTAQAEILPRYARSSVSDRHVGAEPH